MNIIIPMGGQGKRLRPHTLNKSKALISICGKTVLQRIIEEISTHVSQKIHFIGFVLADNIKEEKIDLKNYSKGIDAKPKFYTQKDPLGTAHAIFEARDLLEGPVIIAFSDTLFKTKLKIDDNVDGIVWTKEVTNPSAFGVVKCTDLGFIKSFVEKPTNNVSNQAMIGLYFFKEGRMVRSAIEKLFENNHKTQGEYQLTDAMSYMLESGAKITTQNVNAWMDCGNKEAILSTHKEILDTEAITDHLIIQGASTKENGKAAFETTTFSKKVSKKHKPGEKPHIYNSIIIPPVYLGKNTIINNSVIGPYVSICDNTAIYDSRIQNSIVQESVVVKNANLCDTILGSFVHFEKQPSSVNMGDYSNFSFK